MHGSTTTFHTFSAGFARAFAGKARVNAGKNVRNPKDSDLIDSQDRIDQSYSKFSVSKRGISQGDCDGRC